MSPRSTIARAADGLSRVLAAAAVTALLFAAHQYWGTDLRTAWEQRRLVAQMQAAEGREPGAGEPVAPSPQHSEQAQPHGATTGRPASPAPGEPVGTLAIPGLGVDFVVVAGTGREQLQRGPGLLPGTPLPATGGNSVVAGHRTTWGAPFADLDRLRPGDEVRWTAGGTTTTYTVMPPGGEQSGAIGGAAQATPADGAARVVDPGDRAVVAAQPGQDLITLVTCHPRFSAAQRLVVTARRAGPGPTAPVAAPVVGAAPVTVLALDPEVSWTDPLPAGTVAATLWLLGELLAGRSAHRGFRARAGRGAIRLVAAVLALGPLLVAFDRLADLMPQGV